MKQILQLKRKWLLIAILSILCNVQQSLAQYNLVSTEYPPSFSSNFNLDLGLSPMEKCGNYIAMGSEYHNGGQGIVIIFEYDGTNWVDVASLTASDGDEDDFFGNHIAITDEIIAVTAHNKDGGAVYVFEKPSGGWSGALTEDAKLLPSNASNSSVFGADVSIKGDLVVVGHSRRSMTTGQGCAYVFKKPNTGLWAGTINESATLMYSNVDCKYLGWGVDIIENIIFLGTQNVSANRGGICTYTEPANGWSGEMEPSAVLEVSLDDYEKGSMKASENTLIYAAEEIIFIFEKQASGWISGNENAQLSNTQNSSMGVCFVDNSIIGNSSNKFFIYNKPVNGWVNASESAYFTNSAKYRNFIEENDTLYASTCSIYQDEDPGYFYVFEKPSGGWDNLTLDNPIAQSQLQNNYVTGAAYSFLFADADIDGDYAVVGCPDWGNDNGAAFVYYFNGYTWERQAKLTSSVTNNSGFGTYVSISGNTIVVSACEFNANPVPDGNHVYVFEKNGSTWTDATETAILSVSSGDQMGNDALEDVEINGSTIVALNYYEDKAYVYEKGSSWQNYQTPTAVLTPSSLPGLYSTFGKALSMTESTIAIGMSSYTNNGNGAVYLYEKPVGGWANATEDHIVTHATSADDSYFGSTQIKLTNNMLVVSAERYSESITNGGVIYVYRKPISGWSSQSIPTAKLELTTPISNGFFGQEIDAVEDTVWVADYRYGYNKGKVYAFCKPESGWTDMNESFEIAPESVSYNYYYGNSFAASHGNLVVAAKGDDGMGDDAGIAYFYRNNFVTPTPPDITSVDIDEVEGCNGSVDGGIVIHATSTYTPLTYSIDKGDSFQSSNIFNTLGAGTYDIVVKDSRGVKATTTATINEPDKLIFTSYSYSVPCSGNDGTITLQASGGTQPLEYSFDDDNTYSSNNTATNLANGSYWCVVKDANECQTYFPFEITLDGLEISSVDIIDAACSNPEGSITISATGGNVRTEANRDYYYSIDNGATWNDNAVFTNLNGGTYNIVVKDANDCTSNYLGNPVTISTIATSTYTSVNITNVTGCNGNNNGVINVEASGDGTLSYSFDNGVSYQASNEITGLTAGSYYLKIKDGNGCISPYPSNPVFVTQPAAITITDVELTDHLCSTLGSIEISVQGGTAPYQYSIDDGTTWVSTDSIGDLNEGYYDIVVNDAENCSQTYVSNPVRIYHRFHNPELTSVSTTQATCPSCTDGVIEFSGTDITSYSLDNGIIWTSTIGSSPFSVNGLAAQNYQLIVKSNDGCEIAYENNPIVLGALNDANDITAFSVPNQVTASTINTSNHTVEFKMPYAADVSALIPTITVSNAASISPLSGVEQNFSSPVVYTVTAQNSSEQNWTVSATFEQNNEVNINNFSFAEQTGEATINTTNHTVNVEVAFGTSLTALIPTIAVSSGATVSPNTGVANDFSSATTYRVTAENGIDYQDWTINVGVAPNNDASLSDLLLDDVSIDGFSSTKYTYDIELAYNATSAPTITATPIDDNANPEITQCISLPGSGVVIVTAEDNTTQQTYTVNFTKADPPRYTATFNVNDGENPIENATINFEGSFYNTNSSGVVAVSDLLAGEYNYNITADGFTNSNGILTITNGDLTELVTMTVPVYNVTLTLTDGENSIGLASVEFDGTVYNSDNNGIITIPGVQSGSYTYIASAQGYQDENGTIEVSNADVNKMITLTEIVIPTYSVDFTISDGISAIAGATVVFDGVNYTSDSEGHVFVLNKEAGSYEYSISATNYVSQNGTVEIIDQNIERFITLVSTNLCGNVVISGTLQFGEELTVAVTETNNTGTLSYQWKRDDEIISGTSSETYELVEVDITHSISVEVTSSVQTGSIASAATIAVAKADQAAPGEPTLSSVTYNSIVLEDVTGCEYAINGGAWQSSAEFAELEAETTYALTQRYAETNTHNASPASTSLNVTTDEMPVNALTGTVTISGTLQFGEELIVEVTETNNTGTLSYQWKSDGEDIADANSETYELVEADISKSISVEVSSSVETGSISSTGTAAIEKADQEAPVAPELLAKTHDSITLVLVEGCEYAMDGGAWQQSNVFDGLAEETTYSFTQRFMETDTHFASEASVPAEFTTEEYVSVLSVKHKNLIIYPNPVENTLYIAGCQNHKYTIYSAAGVIVSQGVVNSDMFEVNVSDVKCGLYILVIGNESHRIIKL